MEPHIIPLDSLEILIQYHSISNIVFQKNMCFPESFEFETMNKQKQPEKKQLPTTSSLVVFYTKNLSDLIDKSTSQG